MKFYHGTSTALPIGDTILPPAETGVQREDWRQRWSDKVFLTISYPSAQTYAHKAAAKYGGKPVVYVAKPANPSHKACTEYLADYARIQYAIYP